MHIAMTYDLNIVHFDGPSFSESSGDIVIYENMLMTGKINIKEEISKLGEREFIGSSA